MATDLLASVHPTLAEKITRALNQMHLEGHPMRVCQGLRTTAQQQALYAQGRTAPGKIVTRADGVHVLSNHQSGRAVDCCFTTGEAFGEHQPWARYGELVRAEGLHWGGDWTHPDRPHAELA